MKKYIQFFLIGLSALLIGQGGLILYHCYKSAHWSTASGTIVSSSISHHIGYGKTAPYDSSDITYRYQVGSSSYINDIVMFAPASSSATSKVRQITDRYPVGRQVTVYVPSNPQKSVLELGATGYSWTKVVWGILLIAVAIIIFPIRCKIKGKISVRIN